MVTWTDTRKPRLGFLRRIFARSAIPPAPTPSRVVMTFPTMPSVDAIDTLHVLMVGYGDGALAGPARWLADQGACVTWLSPRLGTLEDLADRAEPVARAATRVMVDIGALSQQARSLGEALGEMRPRPGSARALTHVMVDIDALGGIAVAYDGLRMLRNRRPDLPVIVVSEDLGSNDFSLERLPLCDASLRAPVVYGALEFALTETRDVNNPAWMARLRDLRTPS